MGGAGRGNCIRQVFSRVEFDVLRVIVVICALICQSFPGWMVPVCANECDQPAPVAMSCCESADGKAECSCCSSHEHQDAPTPAPNHHHDHDLRCLPFMSDMAAKTDCPSLCCTVQSMDMRMTPALALIRAAGTLSVAVLALPRPEYEPPDHGLGSFVRSAMRDGSPPREPARYRATLNIWTI